MTDVPLDSKEGIEALLLWAKAHGAVLHEYHRKLAAKYGASTEGVTFTPIKVV